MGFMDSIKEALGGDLPSRFAFNDHPLLQKHFDQLFHVKRVALRPANQKLPQSNRDLLHLL